MKDKRSRLWKIFFTTIRVVILFLLISVYMWPTQLGGKTSYTIVQGSSMEPTLHTNDLVVIRKSANYTIGDIVVFRSGDIYISHRIVAGNATVGFTTRGDNNDIDDGGRVLPEDIRGKRWALLPQGGRVVSFIRSPFGAGIILAQFVVLIGLRFDRYRDQLNGATAVSRQDKGDAQSIGIREPAEDAQIIDLRESVVGAPLIDLRESELDAQPINMRESAGGETSTTIAVHDPARP